MVAAIGLPLASASGSDWAVAAGAGVILLYALLSRRLDGTAVTAAMCFVTCGLLLGSHGAGLIDPGAGSESVRVLAEVTLTLVLFADASRLDLATLRGEYQVPFRLLAIGLPLTILAGWAVAVVLFGSFSAGEALLLAIILAPTDAALGQAVVTDARLPSRIRQGLNVESGLNDGICVPVLFIALAWADTEAGASSTHGAVTLVAEAIGYGTLFGALAGFGGALLLREAMRRGLAEAAWVQVVPVATAALSYGLAAPLGGSGFIAAFVAGLAFGAIRGRAEETYMLEELGGLANAATFIVFGAAIVGPVLSHVTWTDAVYAVLSLTAVRMVPVAISFVGTHAEIPTMLFTGWFGPRGLASIVFTVIVLDESQLSHVSTMTTVVVLTILVSVYAHGVTAGPLTSRYAAWYAAHRERRPEAMETVEAGHQRWRRPSAIPVIGGHRAHGSGD
jgi:NhaP-type Na+/H+ or K+/H+ antiporter